MPTIVTQEYRIGVPDSENIIVKTSGWVKYQKNGEIHHIPPGEVKRIEERDPETEQLEHRDGEKLNSSVVYQSPHGRV